MNLETIDKKSALSLKILSDITTYSKYSKFIPEENRRESWEDTVVRNMQMHIKKFPKLENEIVNAYTQVLNKKVLPSMRSLQFGGKPIEISPNRLYNCAYVAIDNPAAFSETMFLLLGGSGVGYSVQKHHVEKLPDLTGPKKRSRRYLIGDSIEGWADAVKVLVESYFYNKSNPAFDFRDIRPKGAKLITSGGKAPGPQPLKDCLYNIRKVMDNAKAERGIGCQLTTLEVHHIMCYIADAVLAGGIRRAALISLFSFDDDDMLGCKFGNWWETNPHLARANNSAVILRNKIREKQFRKFWEKIQASGSGEPGIYFTNDKDYGCNPSLRAGTKVLTTDGIFPIEKLQDKTFRVKNLDGKISDAECWLSGKDKQLYELTLQGGHKYYPTPEHEWPIWDGSKFIKIKTSDLEEGMELPTIQESSLFNGNLGTNDDGFLAGWMIGDGWRTVRSDNNKLQWGAVVSKSDGENIASKLQLSLAKLRISINFADRGSTFEFNTTNKYLDDYFINYEYLGKEQGLPKKVWTECSEEYRKGLIDGLFSSDGSIEKNNKRICYYSKHLKLVNDVSELLGFYGIRTTIDKVERHIFDKHRTIYQLRISDSISIKHFINIFKLSVKHKQDILDSYSFPYNLTNNRIKITKIELSNVTENVWDIRVKDDTHCFQISHCITGNCCEIALKSMQFCNLTTTNVSDVENQEDLNARVKAAAFIGTLQSSYTEFHYLRDEWQKNSEKEPLLGVSMTGIASGAVLNLDLEEAAKIAVEENKRVAELLGINPAIRVTCIKPEGTASCVLGTSSGIHAWQWNHFIRRLRMGKNEPMYHYLKRAIPDLIEDDVLKPDLQAVLSIPIKAPEGSILRTESAIDLLNRGKYFHEKWVKPGHIDGQNTHNVSITVSVKDDEWESVGNWMWENRDSYNGIAVFPYNGGTYVQAPFEDCDEATYEKMLQSVRKIDLSKVVEEEDLTNHKENVACAGGACTITKL